MEQNIQLVNYKYKDPMDLLQDIEHKEVLWNRIFNL